MNRIWQGSASTVKWSVRLKSGSKVKICVVAINPAVPDSPMSCAKDKVPR